MTRLSLIVVASLAFMMPAAGQLPETRLGQIFPPGGQVGTSFEVQVSGVQDLEYESASRLLFSHAGITAEPVVDAESGRWRDNTFRVTAKSDVPPGRHEAFLVGYYGVSNPRSILLDVSASTAEATDFTESHPATLKADVPCYGRIAGPADIDNFTFMGTAGTTVVVRCAAGQLDSPLQPVVELSGPDGRRIATAGGAFSTSAELPVRLPASGQYTFRLQDAAYRGGEEFSYRIELATRPVVVAVQPPFGQSASRGEFHLLGYNLPQGEAVGTDATLVRQAVAIELPPDDAVTTTAATVWSHQATADGSGQSIDSGLPNGTPISIYPAEHPPVVERESDDPLGQPVSIPVEISGRFEERGDIDHFVIDAKAGDVAYIELFAKRYGSEADPVLTVAQVAGPDGQPKQRHVATADDHSANIAPGVFDTASDDPVLRFEAPEDGRYRLTVHDRYRATRGDESLFYRMSVRSPRPDFQLFAVPHERDSKKNLVSADSVCLRKGENVVVPVYLLRRDDFNGPVHVNAENLPPGLSSKGVTIGDGQSTGELVINAARDAAAWVGPITVIGEATLPEVPGRPAEPVRHIAHVGTVIRGAAGGRTESRLASSLMVSILEESLPFCLQSSGGQLRIGQGSQVLIPLHLDRDQSFSETVNVSMEGLPADAKIASNTTPFTAGQSNQIVRLTIDPQTPPGSYTLQWIANAKIDYSPFPHRLARSKSTQKHAVEELAAADSMLKEAVRVRDEDLHNLQQAETALQTADEQKKVSAATAVEAARKKLAESEAKVETAESKRTQADNARQSADTAAATVTKESAPRKIDYASPSAPVTLTVLPAPFDLQVEAENDGKLPRGQSIELTVSAGRREGFEGPIRCSLSLPPGVQGLSAEPVTIAAGASEAKLKITASESAENGEVPFLAVRAETGETETVQINVPVALTIVP